MEMYNPVTNSFTYYTPTEIPKVKLDLPLLDNPIDLPWASRVTDDGVIISSKEDAPQQLEVEDIFSYTPTLKNVNVEEKTSKTNNIKGDQKTLAVNIVDSLINRSNGAIKPEQASAIVGHLIAESNLTPSKINSKDLGATSGGLGLWRDTRFNKLKLFAKNLGKIWNDLDVLVDFLIHELNTDYSDVYSRLLSTNNTTDASKAWSYYEKFAGYDGNLSSAKKLQRSKGWTDALTKEWIKDLHNKRENNSKEVYELWKQSRNS